MKYPIYDSVTLALHNIGKGGGELVRLVKKANLQGKLYLKEKTEDCVEILCGGYNGFYDHQEYWIEDKDYDTLCKHMAHPIVDLPKGTILYDNLGGELRKKLSEAGEEPIRAVDSTGVTFQMNPELYERYKPVEGIFKDESNS